VCPATEETRRPMVGVEGKVCDVPEAWEKPARYCVSIDERMNRLDVDSDDLTRSKRVDGQPFSNCDPISAPSVFSLATAQDVGVAAPHRIASPRRSPAPPRRSCA